MDSVTGFVQIRFDEMQPNPVFKMKQESLIILYNIRGETRLHRQFKKT